MRLLPTDEEVKEWFAGVKRYLMPLVFLVLPVALPQGDWSQVRVLIMFLSILAGACWFFFLLLSEKEGKGLLPDFHLKPFLDRAGEQAISSAIVVASFFFMFCVFLLVVAFLVAPR